MVDLAGSRNRPLGRRHHRAEDLGRRGGVTSPVEGEALGRRRGRSPEAEARDDRVGIVASRGFPARPDEIRESLPGKGRGKIPL